MSVPAGVLLALPADRAARLLALGRLEEAAGAGERLEHPDGPEALHRFGAALRRLRSTLRAFRPYLRGSVRRRDRRRLRRLEDDARAKRGEGAQAAPRRNLAAEVDRERARLAKRLRRYRAEVDPADPRGGPTCAEVVRRLAPEMAEELRRRLEAARSAEDGDAARRARSAVRHLRYLLEPFAEGVEGLPALVGRLEALQDLLGEMRDPGEGARCFAELEARWGGEGAAGLFAELREVERKLGGAAEDTEIERKYLLSGFPPLDGVVPEEIDQGWLPGERLAERVRRVRSGGEERWYRTVKLGRGVRRVEVEEETPADLAKALWRLTRGRRVRKLRYRVPDGGLVWEIDRFRRRRLVLAEVEIPSEDAPVAFPDWLRPYVVREVTGEPEYVNLNLAR